MPSKAPNPNATPRGTKAKISAKDDAATRRSLTRENEAADTLAKKGYDIEQKPSVTGTRKPDYKIECEIFDSYAPDKGTNVRNLGDRIKKKVVDEQADRIILNLDDWGDKVDDIVKQLIDWPIENLKEVIVVRNGNVTPIFP